MDARGGERFADALRRMKSSLQGRKNPAAKLLRDSNLRADRPFARKDFNVNAGGVKTIRENEHVEYHFSDAGKSRLTRIDRELDAATLRR